MDPATYTRSIRYLENLLPAISYRPASVKNTEKKLTEEQEAARQAYRDRGMDEEAIIAMEHISKANRVDYQVCLIREVSSYDMYLLIICSYLLPL